MITGLIIAVIILAIAVLGIVIYLRYFIEDKIKYYIRENEEINDAIEYGEGKEE